MDVVLVLLGVVLAFYFILLRPVMQQQRRRREDISSLRVGDEVLTAGGFYAVVRDIRTTDSGPMEIDLEAAPGVMLRAAPHAIEQVIRHAADAEAAGDASDHAEDARDAESSEADRLDAPPEGARR